MAFLGPPSFGEQITVSTILADAINRDFSVLTKLNLH